MKTFQAMSLSATPIGPEFLNNSVSTLSGQELSHAIPSAGYPFLALPQTNCELSNDLRFMVLRHVDFARGAIPSGNPVIPQVG